MRQNALRSKLTGKNKLLSSKTEKLFDHTNSHHDDDAKNNIEKN